MIISEPGTGCVTLRTLPSKGRPSRTGSWHRDSISGREAVARRWDFPSDLNNQQLVRLQLDRARIAGEGMPVDEDVELLARGSRQGPGLSKGKGLGPDIEELTEREL